MLEKIVHRVKKARERPVYYIFRGSHLRLVCSAITLVSHAQLGVTGLPTGTINGIFYLRRPKKRPAARRGRSVGSELRVVGVPCARRL